MNSSGSMKLSGIGDCSPAVVRTVIAPLYHALARYDHRRLTLEREGGSAAELEAVTAALSDTFTLSGPYRAADACLRDPESLRAAVRAAAGMRVALQVRRLDTGMPVFYLARTVHDWFTDVRMAVEELYVSPGYPLPDPRFVRLMRLGRERSYLRLAPFRSRVRAALGDKAKDWRVDRTLKALGGHVLAAAWHEDQRLGLLVADHLRIPGFAEAIELLYLALTADACQLRNEVSARELALMASVWRRPAIANFVDRLVSLDGVDLAELPRIAGRHYRALSRAFARLLAVEVPWGPGRSSLRKLLFANCMRFERVALPLRDEPTVVRAGAELARASEQAIDALLCGGAA